MTDRITTKDVTKIIIGPNKQYSICINCRILILYELTKLKLEISLGSKYRVLGPALIAVRR